MSTGSGERQISPNLCPVTHLLHVTSGYACTLNLNLTLGTEIGSSRADSDGSHIGSTVGAGIFDVSGMTPSHHCSRRVGPVLISGAVVDPVGGGERIFDRLMQPRYFINGEI